MAERVRVRDIDDDEGRRLLRIIRRGTGSVVTWRRAQMVLLSAQGMHVAKIAEVPFTSADRVRDVIHNFNADGFEALYPKYEGGRPRTFTLPERRDIKKIAKSKPAEHGLPSSTWSLAKLADFLVAEGVVDDISHEGLRVLLREEGVSFQRLKTWKTSRDPDYAAKKARVEHLYAIADGEVIPEDGEPEVIFCLDEFGPLNLQTHPGRQWAERGGWHKDPDREPRPRRRETYTRPHGVRHLFAAYDLAQDKLYAVQNGFPAADVGTATSANNFFREIGATVGTAAVGAVFTSRLTDQLGSWLSSSGLKAVGDTDSLTPALVHALPARVQDAVVAAYQHALTPVFAYLVPLFLVGAVLAVVLPEKRLAGGPDTERAPEGPESSSSPRVRN
ncbi:helix-turn-helix domain-containing protein [Streptomyces sp. NPDC088921]|uniref:helix-turn-helix domain-containing protein n=1 Tax=unclassified Streptomyces TaxID=2593676 RepID=UPI003420843A